MTDTSSPQKACDQVTRREMLKVIGIGAVGLSSAIQTIGESRSRVRSQRPNILFMMADQHRGDCIGADGNRAILTPNLDRLASEGGLFRRAYSSTPSCPPARTALMTGLSPWNHGLLGYGPIAKRYPTEMAQSLRDAGYYTCGIGKMHYTPQRASHGFHQTILDEDDRENFRSDYSSWFLTEFPGWMPTANVGQPGGEPSLASGLGWNDHRAAVWPFPERLHATHWTGETALKFLRDYHDPRPFFLKVSFMRPHSPYDPPERWMARYAERELPAAFHGAWSDRSARHDERPADDLWRGDVGAEQVRKSRQGYYASVSFVDEQVGRILELLDSRRWLENTLIIYTADHGDMTGDHYLWRKCYAYEASSRIPIIVRWPEALLSVQRGRTFDHPVELRDVVPTLLEAAGVDDQPLKLDGKSLLQLARDPLCEWRPWIDLEHDLCY